MVLLSLFRKNSTARKWRENLRNTKKPILSLGKATRREEEQWRVNGKTAIRAWLMMLNLIDPNRSENFPKKGNSKARFWRLFLWYLEKKSSLFTCDGLGELALSHSILLLQKIHLKSGQKWSHYCAGKHQASLVGKDQQFEWTPTAITWNCAEDKKRAQQLRPHSHRSQMPAFLADVP